MIEKKTLECTCCDRGITGSLYRVFLNARGWTLLKKHAEAKKKKRREERRKKMTPKQRADEDEFYARCPVFTRRTIRAWKTDICEDCFGKYEDSYRYTRDALCASCERPIHEHEQHYRHSYYCSTRCKSHANYQPTTPHVKSCKHCGSEFESRRSDAKFCGSDCRVGAHRVSKAGESGCNGPP